MQKLFATFLYTSILTSMSFAQTGIWKPFKMYIITPDTAIIDKSLYNDRDSIETDNLKSYYSSLTRMEDLLNSKGSSKETQEKLKIQISFAKAQEENVKKVRYFQTISQYSTQIYNFYFNEYEPFSTIRQVPNQKTDLSSLKHLADTLKADYIVFYSNIHTIVQDRSPVLKLTTLLYSNKEQAIIFSKETEGDTDSRGDRWTCNMNVELSCLLTNGVRTSTDAIADILKSRQRKK